MQYSETFYGVEVMWSRLINGAAGLYLEEIGVEKL